MKDKITYQTNHNNRRDKNKITGLSWALRYPEKIMLNSARARAKKLNIEFNLAVEDIIIPEFCPLLGIKLQTKTGDRSNSMFCPSLDRINPEKGYIKGNVAVISQKANLMKNGASKKELLTFSKNIKTYLKKLCIDAQNATPKMLKH